MKPTLFDAFAKAPTSRRKVLQALAALAGTSCLEGLQLAGLDERAMAALRDGGPGGQATGETKLTGRLVFPNSPDYDSARLGWARQFSQFPLVIVFCQNVQDVVNALSWCREHNVALRARSGRHCLEGWSSLDDGVVIDVSDMNQIHVDTSAEVATVQTGATQGAVVTALGKIGYAIPSGGEKTPGIGGVTLGGGIGMLARSMGLASDHLIGVEMVVPSGKQGAEVIQIDEHNHSDLLWACRGGGGGNFGIATSFTFTIRPISTVTIYDATWGSADWQHVSELLSIWQSLAPSADDRLGSTFSANSLKDGSISSGGIFLGSQEAPLRQLLQPLLGIGTPNVTIQTMPYLDAWLHFAAPPDPPRPDKFSSVWVYDAFPPEAIETVHRFLANAPSPQANIWCLNWGGAVSRIPTDATAFYHRQAKFYMEWDSPWTNDTEAGPATAWVEQFREALQPYVNGSYINVPNRSITDLRVYYGDNLARLQEVKRKYDPENVFHFEQSIPLT
ncbi:FAD-binding oxidoreductase [Ktedonobacter sp. SOSP1-52]|uniref:FAD-binding oxidoreductase n=1 Tax=Ktedonobacter sp. SOSP1-52 TaxID=2778366 RepID=UPI0019152995|nr:FAD-binding oxidoreductase [Ktedonobacter sp. SOSP1-52]